jgi:hypothetical protein
MLIPRIGAFGIQDPPETDPSVALRWAHRCNGTVKNTLVHHLLSLLADDNREIPLQQTLKDLRSAFRFRLGEDDARELTSHIGCAANPRKSLQGLATDLVQ